MPKIIAWLLIFQILMQADFAQTAAISYGNQPSAGRYYNVRGIKMYVETYGQGKPLLLIHGNNGNISAFSGIIPYFSKRYRVIAVDSRAQGKTTDLKDSLSFEMMADDFAALLDAMHIDSAYVIGWSDGGINALLLAMRHPEKVIRLASSGANINPDSTAFTKATWDDEKNTYNSDKNKVRVSNKEKNDWKLFMLEWTQPNITLKQLELIRCPALIICGDHDVISIEHTVEIFRHIPLSELWVVPDSGHGTLEDHKDDFNHQVDQFFRKTFKSRN